MPDLFGTGSLIAGLDYHVAHAESLAAEVGGTWKTFAPDDHT
ncbi:hypothetical protein [Nonomuraea sp. NPDC003709]